MTEADFNDIENYLLGRMVQTERNAFEQKLAGNTEFREEVQVITTLHQGIKHYGRKELRSQVFTVAEAPVIPMYLKWIAAAAGIAIAIGTFWVMQPTKNELLFREYYAKVDTIHFANPPAKDETYRIKIDAYNAFKLNDHKEAANQLDKLEQRDPEAELLAGLNKMHLGDYDEAMPNLLQAKTGSPKISRTASWYLALLYLKQNNTEKALVELEPLSVTDSLYRESAVQLLQDLKRAK